MGAVEVVELICAWTMLGFCQSSDSNSEYGSGESDRD